MCLTYLQLRRKQNSPSCGELLYILQFLSVIIMSSVRIHSWLFLSDKSQIVNIPSLREIINSFCTYSFSVSASWWFPVCYKLQQQHHLKLFYILKGGEIWKHWHCHLLCIVFACALCCGVCCTLVITALRSTATTPGQVRGGPGAARPKSWFHLTQHFRLWVNYISLSAQVGILCDFSTLGREDDQKTWLTIFWWQYSFCGI